ncbi:MAG: MBL fold metallo-hydrolase [Acidimicrobiia bacterium]|nr:MBL fold metallo-hydrolase [Acidimicrobiia bacterium]
MHLTFLGAAGTVTGSRFLLEQDGRRLLVDCGLFQGIKSLRRRNWRPFEVPAEEIDAVVLTHAHIDHSGWLPRLVREGFTGPVWCTPGTADLCEILLPDSAHLQEEDAATANRRGSSRHHPALPLFDATDARRALSLLRTAAFGTAFEPTAGFSCTFNPVGHIIGAATVHVAGATGSVGFTGDVGRPDDPLLGSPEPMPACDHLVTESTYGDRRHPATDPAELLGSVIRATVEKGGSVVVPTFAVGRAQLLLHVLAELRDKGGLEGVDVALDSPMAIAASEVLVAHRDHHHLPDSTLQRMFHGVQLCGDPDSSRALARRERPQVILSASGMASGGRVLHHLERLLPDERNAVVFSGYQAAGTRGASLVGGAGEVKIFGRYVPVRASVHVLDGLSAHADYAELCDWLERSDLTPSGVSIVHGEPAGADGLRRRLHDRFDWDAVVRDHGERVRI